MSEPAVQMDFEELLVAEGVISPLHLERARRIAQRLEHPRPVSELLVEMGQLSRAECERVQRLHRARLGLVEILLEEGVLDAGQVEQLNAIRAEQPGRTDRDLLVDSGLVGEEPFLRALSIKHEVPFVIPEVGLVDPTLLSRASLPWLLRHHVLPLRISDGALDAAFADPLDPDLRAEVERIYAMPVRPCCAVSEKIVESLRTLERLRDDRARKPDSGLQYREIREATSPDTTGEGAVAIVDYLMIRSVQMRASDLHIEPLENKVRIRVRVDGALQTLTELPAGFAAQVISRVKVLGGADIAERRLHQDGRIAVKVEGREVDIRVSTYASTYGETLVLRLLDRHRGLVPLEELGFEPRVLANLRDVVLRTSSGMVLVTGPTGSGKTTTLYSFIDYVNRSDIKVISCEDPVEYVLPGVTQCSVHSKSGPTFSDSLRAMMRQDPDVIVVGEVRDPETASLAVEAALTGHKVYSTFHTEDSVGALLRLKEMGVEAYLIASTLSCVVAERLVRRVCARCAAPAEPSRDDLRFLGMSRSDLSGLTLLRGQGCDACGGTGYRGRLGIHEVLLPDDDLRDALLVQTPSRELRRLARAMNGFLSLQEAGLLKVLAGSTTLEEVVANAPRDAEPRSLAALREFQTGGRRS